MQGLKAGKGIIVGIIIGVIAVAAGLTGLVMYNNSKNQTTFIADGFILNAPQTDELNAITETCEQIYFASGTKYNENYNKQIVFKNTSEEQVALEPEQYIHYQDESLGSFTKGVIMDMVTLADEQYGYYSITKNTIVMKNGQNYSVSCRGEQMSLAEFLWKLSDTDYMIVSPTVTLNLGSDYVVVLDGYAQIKYVDNGIVRILHQQGTYQTVSDKAYIETEEGAVLNLASKNFYTDGKAVLSLDSIALGDDSYLTLDDNTTDQPNIPTFNVVNGKDGEMGMNGEQGEDGDEGEEGDQGEQGEQGEQGTQGKQGTSGEQGENGEQGSNGEIGKSGTNGTDGTMGANGSQGYDGADGEDGEDGKRPDDDGTAEPVNLNAQPEVILSSASENYIITPGSASMSLSLSDQDQSLQDGETKIKLYDKKTMKEIEGYDDKFEEYRQLLEKGIPVQMEFDGLAPGTEYLLQIVGKYEIEQNDIREVVLYNKVFATDELGVKLTKEYVTDEKLVLNASKYSSDINKYEVIVYTEHDDEGKPIKLDGYTMTWTVGTANPFSMEYMDGYPSEGVDIKSNTQYYACISNVLVNGSNKSIDLDFSETEIAFMTHKKKPYQQPEGAVATTPVDMVKPTVTTNNRSGVVTIETSPFMDDDKGIVGYRYELYKVEAAGDSYASEPSYVSESTTLSPQSFNLDVNDSSTYVGKIVVLFDDNEKTVEYSTMYSDPIGLTGSAFPLVEVVIDDNHHELLKGHINVIGKSEILASKVSNENPIVITFVSEYDDVLKIELKNETTVNPTKEMYVYNFEIDTLRSNTFYNIAVTAPVDTDQDGNISSAEKSTYVAGEMVRTDDNSRVRLALVGKKMGAAADGDPIPMAFQVGLAFSPEIVASPLAAEDYEYQADVLEYVVVELYSVADSGQETYIASATLTDTNANHHDSDFREKAWLDAADVEVDSTTGNIVAKDGKDPTQYFELNPVSFGLKRDAAVVSSGGKLRIKVVDARDYTLNNPYKNTGNEAIDQENNRNHKNPVYFSVSQNKFDFELRKQHLIADDPNQQMKITPIVNEKADDDHRNSELDKDTIVGFTVDTFIATHDMTEITYYLYQVRPGKNITNSTTLYPKRTASDKNGFDITGSRIYIDDDGNPTLNIVALDKAKGGEEVADLVATYTYNCENDGNSYKANSREVPFYLSDMKWAYKNPGINDKDDKMGRTELERGYGYFVCYTFKGVDPTDSSVLNVIDCGTTTADGAGSTDIYPFCAYRSDIAEVPYYRSPVLSVPKQEPDIERYLWETASKKFTYKYRVSDPDKALDYDASGNIKGFLSNDKSDITKIVFPATSNITLPAGCLGAYESQEFNANSGRYYSMRFAYTLMNGQASNNIDSIPIKHVWNSEAPAIKYDSLSANEVIKDEGGYTYRITFSAADEATIGRVAAIRVTVKGSEGGNDYTAIYDPVYLDASNIQKKDGKCYVFAYLDSSGLKELRENGVQEATVYVDEYYANGPAGMKDFSIAAPIPNLEKSLKDQENVYAVKKYIEGDTDYTYLMNVDGKYNIANAAHLNWATKSLFVPCDTQLPFSENTMSYFGTKYGAGLFTMYMNTSLILAESGKEKTNVGTNVKFDQSGMRAGNEYYIFEKLTTKKIEDNPYAKIQITDIRPGILLDRYATNAGATSAYLEFNAKGIAIDGDTEIFAKLYEIDSIGNSTPIKVAKVADTTNSTIYTTERVAVTDPDAYYQKANYGSNKLYVEQVYDEVKKEYKWVVSLNVQGLSKSSKYGVILFMYDETGNIKPLYSIDADKENNLYTFETENEIDFEFPVSESFYKIYDYDRKDLHIKFRIKGEIGTNIDAYYEIRRNGGDTILKSGTIEKFHDGKLDYYHSDYDKNGNIIIPYNPGGTYVASGQYDVRVYLKNTTTGEIVGDRTVTYTMRQLDTPEFQLPTTTSVDKENEGKSIITTVINWKNPTHSIVDDEYYVYLYKDGEVDPVEQKGPFATNTGEGSETVVFKNLEQSVKYEIKIIGNVDKKNSKKPEDYESIGISQIVTTQTNTTVTYSAQAYRDRVDLKLKTKNYFDDVVKIQYTIYNETKGTRLGNGDIPVDALEAYLPFNTTVDEDTEIKVEIAYYDKDGMKIGNNDIYATVYNSTAPAIPAPQAKAAPSMLSFSRMASRQALSAFSQEDEIDKDDDEESIKDESETKEEPKKLEDLEKLGVKKEVESSASPYISDPVKTKGELENKNVKPVNTPTENDLGNGENQNNNSQEDNGKTEDTPVIPVVETPAQAETTPEAIVNDEAQTEPVVQTENTPVVDNQTEADNTSAAESEPAGE